VGTALKLLLFALVLARRLYRRLPLFSLYVALVVADDFALRWTYHHFGYTSLAAKYEYWSSLGVVLVARALAVAELCWRGLRNSVWLIASRVLAILAFAILVYGMVEAAKNSSPAITFLLTVERSLDFGIAVILVALLRLGLRYEVWIGGIERRVLLGFSVFSTFQIVNNTFMKQWMMKYFSWWVSASVVSLEVAMLIWIAPLLRPLPPMTAPPTLLSEEESVSMLKQVLERMRRIAEEMKRIARSKWK